MWLTFRFWTRYCSFISPSSTASDAGGIRNVDIDRDYAVDALQHGELS